MLRAKTQGERDLLGSFCFTPLRVVELGGSLVLIKHEEENRVGHEFRSLGDRKSVGEDRRGFGENLPSVPPGGVKEEGSPAGGGD